MECYNWNFPKTAFTYFLKEQWPQVTKQRKCSSINGIKLFLEIKADRKLSLDN